MKKIPCTVGILTHNSEETLRRALESVKYFAEIIVNDGGSTDDTLKIAKEYGASIITQDSKCKNADGTLKDFSCAKNQLLKKAHYNWFLVIDSDEALSDELCCEIDNIIKTNKNDVPYVYKIPVCMVIDDRKIKHSSNYPGYQYRFFNKKSGAHFVKPVHEKIIYDTSYGISKVLASPWFVFSTKNEMIHYIQHTKKYIKMEAQRSISIPFLKYLRFYVWGMLIISMKVIIKSFLIYIRYGFKDTMPIRTEMGRAIYPLLVLYESTVLRVKSVIQNK